MVLAAGGSGRYNRDAMKMPVALVVLAAFLAVGWVFGDTGDREVLLKRRGIFAAPEPPPPTETRSILKPVVPPLDSLVEVLGIAYVPAGRSHALVRRLKTGEAAFYEEGDVIERARIVRISPETVAFEYEGKEVELNLERQVTPSGPVSPAPAEGSRAPIVSAGPAIRSNPLVKATSTPRVVCPSMTM